MSRYSLVRFVADPERAEPVNVGIVLATSDQVRVQFTRRDEVYDWSVVERFEELLTHIIEDVGDPGLILADVVERRFPHFEFTAPRVLEVEDVDEAINRLSSRLVSAGSHAGA